MTKHEDPILAETVWSNYLEKLDLLAQRARLIQDRIEDLMGGEDDFGFDSFQRAILDQAMLAKGREFAARKGVRT